MTDVVGDAVAVAVGVGVGVIGGVGVAEGVAVGIGGGVGVGQGGEDRTVIVSMFQPTLAPMQSVARRKRNWIL